jgi:hypothetical protein
MLPPMYVDPINYNTIERETDMDENRGIRPHQPAIGGFCSYPRSPDESASHMRCTKQAMNISSASPVYYVLGG